MTTTPRPYVERGPVALIPITSVLTGRTIGVNPLLHQFLLTPGWAASRVRESQRHFDAIIQTSQAAFVSHSRRATRQLFAATTRDAFADELETLITRMRWTTWHSVRSFQREERVNPDDSMKPTKTADLPTVEHCGLLLAVLWKNGLILYPRAEAFSFRTLRGRTYRGVTQLMPNSVSEEMAASVVGLAPTAAIRARNALRLWVMIASDVQSLADFDETALRLVPFDGQTPRGSQRTYSLLGAIHTAHRIACANNATLLERIPASYRHLRPRQASGNDQGRSDPAFHWIDTEVPKYTAWRPVLESHIGAISGRVSTVSVIGTLSHMLTRLFEHPDTTLEPLAMCEDAATSAQAIRALFLHDAKLGSHSRKKVALLRAFFDFVIEQSAPPDGAPNPRYHNPVSRIKLRGRSRPAQTHRDPIPNRLMREIRDVLLDPEETWARSLDSDYFVHVDSRTGATSRVFSPVRLEFLRLRLLLPLRTFQVRLLDSGEGDSERFENTDPHDPRVGRWVPNTGAWAAPKRTYGFLRRMYDGQAMRGFVGLFISTNKTADQATNFATPGYEIPFENAELIALAQRVRQFQENYNPSRGPLKRSVLQRPGTVPADVEARLPGLHFLFRDTATVRGNRTHPLSEERVKDFWRRLLDHIEQQVAKRIAAGDPRGWEKPPELILRRDAGTAGTPERAAYDLHTLRVTGITELHMAGCPLPVLQMLAGHATFLMTMHYIKYSPSQFTRALDDAMATADEQALDGAAWEDLAAAGTLEAMRELYVPNSNEVFERYKDSRDGWLHMDYGVCMAGGTLCDSGGEVLVKNHRDGHQHAPVKGGTRNCTSCRFFAAPIHAAGGLAARLNATSLKVCNAGERLRVVEELRRDVFIKAQSATERTPTQIRADQRRWERVEAAAEEALEEVKLLNAIWTSTWELTERLKALRQKERESAGSAGPESTGKLAMAAVGGPADVQFALNQCSDFDLATRICEDCEFYHSVDATDASLRRALRLDRVLAEAGRHAVFATLSAEDLVHVGNAYARWLRTTLGEADMAAVVEGRKTLVGAGLLDESDRVLAQYRSTAAVTAVAGPEDAPRLLPAAT